MGKDELYNYVLTKDIMENINDPTIYSIKTHLILINKIYQ